MHGKELGITQFTGVIRRIIAPTQQSQDKSPQAQIIVVQTDDGKRFTRYRPGNKGSFAPGDEVIVTKYTFPEQRIVSCQIDPKGLGI